MIEAVRRDKYDVLQCAMVSAVVSWLARSMTCRQRHAEFQTNQSEAIRSIEVCS